MDAHSRITNTSLKITDRAVPRAIGLKESQILKSEFTQGFTEVFCGPTQTLVKSEVHRELSYSLMQHRFPLEHWCGIIELVVAIRTCQLPVLLR